MYITKHFLKMSFRTLIAAILSVITLKKYREQRKAKAEARAKAAEAEAKARAEAAEAEAKAQAKARAEAQVIAESRERKRAEAEAHRVAKRNAEIEAEKKYSYLLNMSEESVISKCLWFYSYRRFNENKIVEELLAYFHTKYPETFVDGIEGYDFGKLISSSDSYEKDMHTFFKQQPKFIAEMKAKAMDEKPFWKQLVKYQWVTVFKKNGEEMSILCNVGLEEISQHFKLTPLSLLTHIQFYPELQKAVDLYVQDKVVLLQNATHQTIV